MTVRHYWIINRKERWGLSPWGWLLILVVTGFLIYLITTHIYPFLAPVKPIKAQVLVVEGSAPDYLLDSAMQQFSHGNYQLLATTGIPLEWGHLLAQYKNSALVAAASLKAMGFDTTRLIAVATNEIRNNRTFNAALAFAHFIKAKYPQYKSVNLMSYGAHSRRSWMMYKEALGPDYQVGVISIPSFYYNRYNWWKSSKGFREVINELIGYVYVELFFKPYVLDSTAHDATPVK